MYREREQAKTLPPQSSCSKPICPQDLVGICRDSEFPVATLAANDPHPSADKTSHTSGTVRLIQHWWSALPYPEASALRAAPYLRFVHRIDLCRQRGE
jgi:hypothetical protein